MEHPGKQLKRMMIERNLTPKQVSLTASIDRSTLHRVIVGDTGITVGMAFKLAQAVGESPKYWLDLQTSYNVAQWGADQ